MAYLVDAMRDILTQLRSRNVISGDLQSVEPYVRVWKNQLDLLEAGLMQAFPLPAFFLEVESSLLYTNIGQNTHSTKPKFRIHIAHEFYDSADGTMEQDLKVFEIRTSVIQTIQSFVPSCCGPLDLVDEELDYKYTNIYHLVLGFSAELIEQAGANYDPNAPKYQFTTEPVDAQYEVNKNIGGSSIKRTFNIPKNK